MTRYQVLDLATAKEADSVQVIAPTPEKAAELVLGLALVCSGHPRNLRARLLPENRRAAVYGEALHQNF